MTTEAKLIVERLRATIHQINGHWWNRRKRPDARDVYEAAAMIERQAEQIRAMAMQAIVDGGQYCDNVERIERLERENAELKAADRDHLSARRGMEKLIAHALDSIGASYATDAGGGNPSGLDFRLASGIEIEVKRMHTPRIAEQMSRAPNVIVAQGEEAVRFLAFLIRSSARVKDNRP